jgi:deoxyribose-phosphate aldolase
MSAPNLDRVTLARMIDHTLLKPESTPDDVRALCAEAIELGVFSVCVSPSLAAVARRTLDSHVALAVVCGFPSGAHLSEAKAAEAAASAAQGVDEIDMVVNLGQVRTGDWAAVEADIGAVRAAAPNVLLKVIIESAALRDTEIVRACQVSEAAGADFVKTSTGFHPSGGASPAAVRLMAHTVGGRLGVKASGGIRTSADALAMVAAGATRLGCSATRAILDGLGEV